MPRLYFDTTATLKRYVAETGSESVDLVFEKAEVGEVSITMSLWNVGEALGVLDEKRRRGWLDQAEFEGCITWFADELVKLLHLKAIEVLPLSTSTLIDT